MGLIPREIHFFDLLEGQAETVVRGATLLRALLDSPRSLDSVAEASRVIHEVEHVGDDLVHRLMERLNKSFVTPLDREDIHELCSRLDDVLDYIDAVAKRLVLFRIQSPTDHAIELSRIVERSCLDVLEGVRLLRDLRRHDAIIRQCTRINQLENDADQVMREALDELFNGHPRDPLEVLKWKDLYEHLEGAADRCEDVANIIEAVLVKYG